jgi:hypothetical protein
MNVPKFKATNQARRSQCQLSGHFFCDASIVPRVAQMKIFVDVLVAAEGDVREHEPSAVRFHEHGPIPPRSKQSKKIGLSIR